jgi:hypothetical protein
VADRGPGAQCGEHFLEYPAKARNHRRIEAHRIFRRTLDLITLHPVGNECVRAFLTLCTRCNVCIASGTNVYVSFRHSGDSRR